MTQRLPRTPHPLVAQAVNRVAPGVAARATDLRKVYGQGATEVVALDSVSVAVDHGCFMAIMVPSGSGKSTPMRCMAVLDPMSGGSARIGDIELSGLKGKQLTRLRRDKTGFVFQAFNLLPAPTAPENITLPMDVTGREPDRAWLERVVDTVGLSRRLQQKPCRLSGGQQQRVAVARAPVSRPEIVFADEPTGNLDSRSGAEVLGFLRSTVDGTGQTVVMVTHDPVAAAHADRVIFLVDGRIRDMPDRPAADAVLDRMLSLSPAPSSGSDAAGHSG